MEFKEVFEHVTHEFVLEGLGLIFGIGLVWEIFFGSTLTELVELLINLSC